MKEIRLTHKIYPNPTLDGQMEEKKKERNWKLFNNNYCDFFVIIPLPSKVKTVLSRKITLTFRILLLSISLNFLRENNYLNLWRWLGSIYFFFMKVMLKRERIISFTKLVAFILLLFNRKEKCLFTVKEEMCLTFNYSQA